MTAGLVIGKFHPLHAGHIALIRFAAEKCGSVTVLLGALPGENVPGHVRLGWLWETFRADPRVTIAYTEGDLPDSPVPDRTVSSVWAEYLSVRFPAARTIVSSEGYGEYLAEHMGIGHLEFDPERKAFPVSGSMIRSSPYEHWEFLAPAARQWYLRTICIFGPESTGKSILTERLARRFRTAYVPEVARSIIDGGGGRVTCEMIERIGRAHADAILEARAVASRFLFVDTDLEITRLFSMHYFGKVPEFPAWVRSANVFDFYVFCETDTPYVSDSQRDSEEKRPEFRRLLEEALRKKNAHYVIVSGGWEERFAQAVNAINARYGTPAKMFGE
jgi:HTH-type transcriptional repressor of NAD biosynthesis genes